MLNNKTFYNLLIENGITFFTGVPDSLLKDFLAYVTEQTDKDNHIITANEGNAIALAAGYHLATGKIGLVYMQNSGMGNAFNPLTSLVDKEVYSIPVLLLIGWRGEPGKKDEPQHIKQGRITEDLLKVLEIPFTILPDDPDRAREVIERAMVFMRKESVPFAILVRKGTFHTHKFKDEGEEIYPLNREEAIKIIINNLSLQDIVISTTGMASRELFEYREERKEDHKRDFLTVGSMGHASQIALGISLWRDSNVYCLDGDGAFIMHMGGLSVIGSRGLRNFKHIVINNGSHDSVGGQPTEGFNINITSVAGACGYRSVFMAYTEEDIIEKFNLLKKAEGPSLLEIRVKKGARKNLGRPTISPVENKRSFMNFLMQE
ncbi:MAG TPA: phosphonopyruvate decarboxylase [Candidatus Eremiobacteraeota bacterium]|nr:MAG: hypothetical protein BWY64_02480 [bacterium ADurb.Bin363]HPZ09728.1 phosphonopyruvate decarboxylase [Candidatus Eremiobacteraeota bacterium]